MKIGLTFDLRSGSDDEPLRGRRISAPAPAAAGGPLFPRDDDEEEFDSPETIHTLKETLESFGHEVEPLGDGEPLLRRLLSGPRPDFVFNIAEGRGVGRSREARVPAVLEMLGIPYSGSDPLTLSAALDKDCAKRLVQAAGVMTPGWVLVNDSESLPNTESLADLPWPRIVKPAYEGSSKGVRNVCLVYTPEEQEAVVREMHPQYRQPLLVEEFIDGAELTVGVVGNRPPEVLGIMRVVPTAEADGPFVYSLEVKRDWKRRVRYECPAQLNHAENQAVIRAALWSWRALGCRDVARIDFRLRGGVPYFLEANPLPGMSPTSGDLVVLSGLQGLGYPDLVRKILESALQRIGK